MRVGHRAAVEISDLDPRAAGSYRTLVAVNMNFVAIHLQRPALGIDHRRIAGFRTGRRPARTMRREAARASYDHEAAAADRQCDSYLLHRLSSRRRHHKHPTTPQT